MSDVSAYSGVLPSPETLTAIGILSVTYLIRLASVGAPMIDTPAPLLWATDFLIPLIAAAWLFVASAFVLIATFDERV